MNPLNIIVLTVLLFVIRTFFFDYIFFPIGRKKLTNDANLSKTLKKLSESGYKVVYYLPLWIWGVYIANQEGLLTNTRKFWEGIPNPPISDNLNFFYTAQLAFYIYTTISLVCFDVKRKDYYALLIHHIVTIGLIYFSWHFGYVRVGTVVFICMDVVDVFLESAKFTNYLKLPHFPNVFFTMMVLTWLIFRLGLFPYLVVRSAFSEATDVHAQEGHEYKMSTWYLFNSLLWALQALQIYWFYFVLKALIRMLKTGKAEDVTDKEFEKERMLKQEKQIKKHE